MGSGNAACNARESTTQTERQSLRTIDVLTSTIQDVPGVSAEMARCTVRHKLAMQGADRVTHSTWTRRDLA